AFVKKNRQNGHQSKISDGGGLYLMVSPAGTPLWRVKYRLGGKEKLYSIAGAYPEVSLDEARKEREAVKSSTKEGRDPVATRRLRRATALTASEDTYVKVCMQWLEKRKAEWSEIHYRNSRRNQEKDVLPFLGKLPISEITP